MAFSGVRHTKKMLKEVEFALSELQKAKEYLEYCNDTSGMRCDGRPDEIDASKEHAESEAYGHMDEAMESLYRYLTSE
jgi:hypothetical protein